MDREKLEEKKNIIYVYSSEEIHPGALKIGETKNNSGKGKVLPRIIEQTRGLPINVKEELRFESVHSDKEIHKKLKSMGFEQLKNGSGYGIEWFKCSVEDVILAEMSLLGFPVDYWTGKFRDDIVSLRKFADDLGIKASNKSYISKLKSQLEAIRKDCGGKCVTKKEVSDILIELKELTDKYGNLNKLLEVVRTLKDLEERKDGVNNVKDMLDDINFCMTSYGYTVSDFKEVYSAYNETTKTSENEWAFRSMLEDLKRIGCNNLVDVEKLKSHIKEIKKDIKSITFTSLIPQDNIDIDYVKSLEYRSGIHKGEPIWMVALTDTGYFNASLNNAYNNLIDSGIVKQAIKNKKLNKEDISSMNKKIIYNSSDKLRKFWNDKSEEDNAIENSSKFTVFY